MLWKLVFSSIQGCFCFSAARLVFVILSLLISFESRWPQPSNYFLIPLDVEGWPFKKGQKRRTQYYQGCPSRINAHWSSNFSFETLGAPVQWLPSFSAGSVPEPWSFLQSQIPRFDSRPRSYISFLASQIRRTGTFDTCVTGDRPGPSWKTGSRINYHQSGDELLEYIITNMSNTIPWTELSFPLNVESKCFFLTAFINTI